MNYPDVHTNPPVENTGLRTADLFLFDLMLLLRWKWPENDHGRPERNLGSHTVQTVHFPVGERASWDAPHHAKVTLTSGAEPSLKSKCEAGSLAQAAVLLSILYLSVYSKPALYKPVVVVHTWDPSTLWWRQEAQKFKAMLAVRV